MVAQACLRLASAPFVADLVLRLGQSTSHGRPSVGVSLAMSAPLDYALRPAASLSSRLLRAAVEGGLKRGVRLMLSGGIATSCASSGLFSI